MDEQEANEVRRVIQSGWVTQGPEVAQFESEFARFVGAPHACADQETEIEDNLLDTEI